MCLQTDVRPRCGIDGTPINGTTYTALKKTTAYFISKDFCKDRMQVKIRSDYCNCRSGEHFL